MPGTGCNNEAELQALCLALELGREAGASHLIVRGDSDVGLSYVRGPEATKIDRLHVLVVRARDLLQSFEEVEMIWIPRHRNGEADRLSRHALSLPEKPHKLAGKRRRRA